MRHLSRLRQLACAAFLIGSALNAAAADRVLLLAHRGAALIRQLPPFLQARAARGLEPLELVIREIDGNPIVTPDGRPMRMPIEGRYRLIVTSTLALARAAQLQDPQTPIVFEGAADPVLSCLVDSLARPGRNATGFSSSLDEGPKTLDTLLEAFPQVRRVVQLVSAENMSPADCSGAPDPLPPSCTPGIREPDPFLERLMPAAKLREHARRRGVELRFLLICDAADLALVGRQSKAETGFIVPLHYLFYANMRELINRIGATRRPAVFPGGLYARLGAVLAVQTVVDEVDARATLDLVQKVLDGASPAELPVILPRGFAVTVNAWSAAAQGLHPSLAILRRADQIIVQPPRAR